MQKWGSHKAPPKQHCKEHYGISHLGQFRVTGITSFVQPVLGGERSSNAFESGWNLTYM